MTAVLQINTAPAAALRLADNTEGRIATRHPAQDSPLSIAAAGRRNEHRPVRARSVVAALALGLVIGAMAWMHGDTAAAEQVDDAKVDVMAVVES